MIVLILKNIRNDLVKIAKKHKCNHYFKNMNDESCRILSTLLDKNKEMPINPSLYPYVWGITQDELGELVDVYAVEQKKPQDFFDKPKCITSRHSGSLFILSEIENSFFQKRIRP